MTTYYKATFSNGVVLTRSTAGRAYSHAWMMHAACDPNGQWAGQTWTNQGFSGSERLARNALGSCTSGRQTLFAETAPAVEISAQEYRAMKKGGK